MAEIITDNKNKVHVEKMNFYYGAVQALFDINMDIAEKKVTAFIGPSGCGKSTFLRTLNRMNDIIDGTRIEGKVMIDGSDIYGPMTDVVGLRKKVGMIFQKSKYRTAGTCCWQPVVGLFRPGSQIKW